jgi:RNA polymerase primary sigma factor
MQTAMSTLDWQIQRARRIPIPSRQEQLLLGRAIREWQDHPDGPDGAPPLVQKRGRRAFDRLVSGNLRLVAQMVAKRKDVTGAIGQDDLMQLGSEGLMKAAIKFRPELGYSFTTYATWWVRQAIQRSRRDRYTIPLPHQMASTVERARLVLAQMERPDLDLAAERCSTASHVVTRAELERAFQMEAMANARSLDATCGDDESWSLGSVVSDSDVVSLWDQVQQAAEVERLELALEALEPKEREMVQAVTVRGDSFQAVATRMGVHRDSVRKAHGRALSKLRHSLETQRAA